MTKAHTRRPSSQTELNLNAADEVSAKALKSEKIALEKKKYLFIALLHILIV